MYEMLISGAVPGQDLLDPQPARAKTCWIPSQPGPKYPTLSAKLALMGLGRLFYVKYIFFGNVLYVDFYFLYIDIVPVNFTIPMQRYTSCN